jgi:hypothetical protein
LVDGFSTHVVSPLWATALTNASSAALCQLHQSPKSLGKIFLSTTNLTFQLVHKWTDLFLNLTSLSALQITFSCM